MLDGADRPGGIGAAFVAMLLWFLAAVVFRLRFQFSIRSLLMLMVVVAIPCSWLAEARKQREIVVEIEKAGGEVHYDFQLDPSFNGVSGAKPPGPAWLRKWLGDDLLVNVTWVSLHDRDVGDAEVQRLKGLPQLQWLDLSYTKLSDAGLKHIEGLTQLQWLWLRGTKLSDAGLEHLEALTKLQELFLDDTKVSDAGLEHLKRLTQLQCLELTGTKVSNAGLDRLKGLARLRWLYLVGTKVSDAGLESPQGTDPTPTPGARPHQDERRRAGAHQRIARTPNPVRRWRPR